MIVASSHCLDLIRKFEGLRTKAYKAHFSEKYFTIGYGHYGPDVHEGDVCTTAYADLLLKRDVNKFESELVRALNADEIEVNQNQFDALLSFAFNVGTSNLLASTLWKKLKQRDYEGAANQFLRWNKCNGIELPGLTKRREAERTLFLS
ncbi:MAG: lysozyme [Succinivibrio dextrinosolvens]|nr:lysozyme [Succinivibrio dextrinosolvens]MDY6420972.1 lysozyme [Succinivibrio dextrinosolvens]MDY6465012.1 lysozyme [Succinivibrio dextrinosolvens]MDY6469896.1 lysozyme [Succinivibrio dextrinosolvens]